MTFYLAKLWLDDSLQVFYRNPEINREFVVWQLQKKTIEKKQAAGSGTAWYDDNKLTNAFSYTSLLEMSVSIPLHVYLLQTEKHTSTAILLKASRQFC